MARHPADEKQTLRTTSWRGTGLGDKIVFAVSQRLRVSEEVLGADQAGALYVYKGVMNARAVLAAVEGLVGRT